MRVVNNICRWFPNYPLLRFLYPILQPGVTVKHCKEGTESSAFWFALDGKQSYTSKPIMQDTIVRDPHLYAFSIRKG